MRLFVLQALAASLAISKTSDKGKIKGECIMPKKKTVDENIVGVPNFEEMDDDELERQATILKLKKEWLAVSKESFTKLERERELCSIRTAIREFHKFLNPVRDFLLALPNIVQDLVPTLTPDEYMAIENEVAEQTNRLADNALHLTLESSRDEKDASTQIQRENQRRSNRINGRKREN